MRHCPEASPADRGRARRKFRELQSTVAKDVFTKITEMARVGGEVPDKSV